MIEREETLLGVVDRVLGLLDGEKRRFDPRCNLAFAGLQLDQALVDRDLALFQLLYFAPRGEETSAAASAFHPGAPDHFAVESDERSVERFGNGETVFESAHDQRVAQAELDRVAIGQADPVQAGQSAHDARVVRQRQRSARSAGPSEDQERSAAFARLGESRHSRPRGLGVGNDQRLEGVAQKALDRLLVFRRHFDGVREDTLNEGGGTVVEQRPHARIEGAVGGHEFLERCAPADELIPLAMEGVEFAAQIPSFGFRFDSVRPGAFELQGELGLDRLDLFASRRGLNERARDALAFTGHFLELGPELGQGRLRPLHAFVSGASRRTEGGDAGQGRELGGPGRVHVGLDTAERHHGLIEERLDALERPFAFGALFGVGEHIGLVLLEAFAERGETRSQVLGFLRGGLRTRHCVPRLVAAVRRMGFELVGLESQIGVLGANGLECSLLLHDSKAGGLELGFPGRDGGVDALRAPGLNLRSIREFIRVRL